MSKTRIPTQQRSIEKRNRIIEQGFILMCQNGYHQTNTVDIAKEAKVSTGIIYQYFKDKKEIFIEGATRYEKNIMFPVLAIIDENAILKDDLRTFMKKIIDTTKKQHTFSERAHQELSSMQHLDRDVENIFKTSELAFSNKLYLLLINNNYQNKDLKERCHLIVNLIDNFAHEEVYHRHQDFDYQKMEDIVLDTICDILKK